MVFGRSIGSGPATYLASTKNIGALILMSPFMSIRAAVKDIAGSWAQYLIKERFNNIEAIKTVSCPTFFVHGQKDGVVSFQHSKKLHGNKLYICYPHSNAVIPMIYRDLSRTERVSVA